jgi:hypothetical protein
LKARSRDCRVVLTGSGTRFSAGLDLGEHFRRTEPQVDPPAVRGNLLMASRLVERSRNEPIRFEKSNR